MRTPGWRRGALALVVLVAGCATIAVLDPHRAVDSEPEYTVNPDLSPSVVWRHAEGNTVGVPVRVTARTYPAPDNETLLRKWVHGYDPDARQYRGALFYRNDDEAPAEWSTSQLYASDTVEAQLLGDVSEPSLSSQPVDTAVDVEPTYRAFSSGSLLATLDADEFRVRSSNETRIVLGVTGADGYADLHDVNEGRIEDGSFYRVSIDRDAGRIAEIRDYRIANRADGSVATYRVLSFTYRNVTIERPSWAQWHAIELVYDALSL